MTTVDIHEFKARLFTYVGEVKNGGTVIVCDGNAPFAELRPLEKRPASARPAPGLFKDQIQVTDAFFASDGELEADFNG